MSKGYKRDPSKGVYFDDAGNWITYEEHLALQADAEISEKLATVEPAAYVSKLNLYTRCNVTDLCRFYDADRGVVPDDIILVRVEALLSFGLKIDSVLYLRALFAAVAELEGGDSV